MIFFNLKSRIVIKGIFFLFFKYLPIELKKKNLLFNYLII